MSVLKVLIVDDSLVYRKVITRAVEKTGLADHIQTASTAHLALERLEQNTYDVVLLDVVMPEMDGLELLKIVRERYKDCAVIMISGHGGQSEENTITALKLGAMDFVLKPTDSDPERNMEKISSILKLLLAQIAIQKAPRTRPVVAPSTPTMVPSPPPSLQRSRSAPDLNQRFDLLVIASSTGGPVALKEVFSSLSKSLPVPVLVVQHMPPSFTHSLAVSLTKDTGFPVVEACDNMELRPGAAILAKGGTHLGVVRNGASCFVQNLSTTPVNGLRPAVDVTLAEVGEAYRGGQILVAVLTGMGNDGEKGVRALRNSCRCFCLAQSEESCVVYGMPRAIVDSGLHDEVTPLSEIGRRLSSLAGKR